MAVQTPSMGFKLVPNERIIASGYQTVNGDGRTEDRAPRNGPIPDTIPLTVSYPAVHGFHFTENRSMPEVVQPIMVHFVEETLQINVHNPPESPVNVSLSLQGTYKPVTKQCGWFPEANIHQTCKR